MEASARPAFAHAAPVAAAIPAAPAPAAKGDAKAEVKADKPGTIVTSPFVGTFYRAPSPDAAPFVEVGLKVKKGQMLCIVEAMKLMNEIESEVGRDGRRDPRRRTPRRWSSASRSSASSGLARPERSMFKKVLIANRGEIALRVIRACKELGHRHGRRPLHGRRRVAPRPLRRRGDLHRPAAVEARATSTSARSSPPPDITGADAIHPGYGFLSENAEFAEMVDADAASRSSARARR